MQIIRKKLVLSKLDYYKTHLSFINCILPVKMTPKEIEVLAGFMSLEGDIAKYRFGRTARKLIMNTLGLLPSGLSNYIISLKEKGFIREDAAKELAIWSLLSPEQNEQEYQFKIVRDINIPDTITNETTSKTRKDSSNNTVINNNNISNSHDDNSVDDTNGYEPEEPITESNLELTEE